jgi:hypothetical protein
MLICFTSQWRQTLAARDVISARAASGGAISVWKVSSAPIDFWGQSGSTGRSSIPRAIR